MISIKEIKYENLKAYAQNLEKYSTEANVINPNRIYGGFEVDDTFVFLSFEGKCDALQKEIENIKLACVINEIFIALYGNHEMCLEEISNTIELVHKCVPFKKLHPSVEWIFDDSLNDIKADVIILKKRTILMTKGRKPL